jgi:hypothetical protein
LRRIEALAFFECERLKSIYIPDLVEVIDGSAFSRSGISSITISRDNPNFRVSGDFIVSPDGTSAILYFGKKDELIVSRDIETLCAYCFFYCFSISSVAFEPD